MLKRKYENIKLLVRPAKNGLASAIVDGMGIAASDNIAVMDGDLQHPPDLLTEMVEKVKNGTDLVIASRYTAGGNPGRLGFTRKLISKTATIMAHVMLRETKHVKDPLSGYFVFKRNIVRSSDFDPSGYKILLELLIKGKASSKEEIPYTFKPRFMGSSKLSIWEDLNYVHLILRLAGYRPLKFIGVGISGVLVNDGLLFLLHEVAGLALLISDAISIEASIISNFAINSLWTFRNRKVGRLYARLFKYNLVALFGGVINYGAFYLITLITPHYLVANTIGIGLGFLANYLGSELFVWSAIGSRKKNL